MNNTEANRRLLDSLELQLKVNKPTTNLRARIRARSKRVYPVQKCTVYVCQELGERHHESYTETKCIFLCHKHHSMLHSLKKQLKVHYLSKDIMDKFLALGCEL